MATQINYHTGMVTITLTMKQHEHMVRMLELAKKVLVKKQERLISLITTSDPVPDQIIEPVPAPIMEPVNEPNVELEIDPLLSGDLWAQTFDTRVKEPVVTPVENPVQLLLPAAKEEQPVSVIEEQPVEEQPVIPFEAFIHIQQYAFDHGLELPEVVRVSKGYLLQPMLDCPNKEIQTMAKYVAGVTNSITKKLFRYLCTQLMQNWHMIPTDFTELHYFYSICRYSNPIAGMSFPQDPSTKILKAFCEDRNIPAKGKKTLKDTWRTAVREYYRDQPLIHLHKIYTR